MRQGKWPRGRAWQILVAVLLAGSIFTFGRFGFFDLFGGKRIVEGVILILLGGLSPYFVRFGGWRNMVFAMAVVFFISELLLRRNMINAADNAIGMLLVLAFFALTEQGSDLCTRLFIAFAGVFACLGIVQWVILFIAPEHIPEVTVLYQDYSSSGGTLLEYPLRFLGLVTGEDYQFLGFHMTRLRSFLSEPSLIIAFFLLPGALALTYTGAWKRWAVPLLVFSVISFSGSVYFAIALGVMAAPLLIFTKHYPKVGVALPFLLVLFASIGVVGSDRLASLILLVQVATADTATFLDKAHSFTERFAGVQDTFTAVRASPFGLHDELLVPVGLLLHAAALAGIVGVILITVLLWRLLGDTVRAVGNRALRWHQTGGVILVYGIFFEAIIFSSYGFTNGTGILMIGITMLRLATLVPREEMNPQAEALMIPSIVPTPIPRHTIT